MNNTGSGNTKGLAYLEYIFVILVFLWAFLSFSFYIRNAYMGQFRKAGETFASGRQYSAVRTHECVFEAEVALNGVVTGDYQRNVMYSQACYDHKVAVDNCSSSADLNCFNWAKLCCAGKVSANCGGVTPYACAGSGSSISPPTCISDCSCEVNTCVGQTCSDGCGGTCAGLRTGVGCASTCSPPNGTCEAVAGENCANCSDCACAAPAVCFNNACCTPNCIGATCGGNGCGGICGTGTCSPPSTCYLGSCCTPDCTVPECGDDSCGDTCGFCTSPETCNIFGQCDANPCVGLPPSYSSPCSLDGNGQPFSCVAACSSVACTVQCDAGYHCAGSACAPDSSECQGMPDGSSCNYGLGGITFCSPQTCQSGFCGGPCTEGATKTIPVGYYNNGTYCGCNTSIPTGYWREYMTCTGGTWTKTSECGPSCSGCGVSCSVSCP
jgi:hypothetical protein